MMVVIYPHVTAKATTCILPVGDDGLKTLNAVTLKSVV